MSVGVVVIGRNEGERLERCLRSLLAQDVAVIVYVDSGSDDGSVELARSLGVHGVELDMSRPFTMARGRNAGLSYLGRHTDVSMVQFVDGDCEVNASWIDVAEGCLRERPDVAAVCGRRRERYPDESLYNRLIDMEWNGPLGEVRACGGDAMFRMQPLSASGGYDETMIGGEEPELCVRLRAQGWKILRVADEMTLHDAALRRLDQWWKRSKRCGHAYAHGMWLHGRSADRHNVRQTLSALTYGLALPFGFATAWAALLVLAFLGGAGSIWWAALVVFVSGAFALPYLRVGRRVFQHRLALGDPPLDAVVYATFCLLGKVPESAGVLTFLWNRLRGRQTGIIEYKTNPSAPAFRVAPTEASV